MPSTARFLEAASQFPAAESPEPLDVDSDVVVILAALLCALICIVGLALAARCAWLRRSSGASSGAPPPPPSKGLKKKALQLLPKVSFDVSAADGGWLADCPICLAEFVDGDEIRILPQCGHGFHAECVDTWLGSRSSCPSCRQILVVPTPSRCRRCGASSDEPAASAAAAAAEGCSKAREDGDVNRFMP